MLDKKAIDILNGLGQIAGAVGDIGALASTYLIATAVLAGTGVGWTAAKITAHGKQDEDTAKKGYENERLKADLGYLSGKLRQEHAAYSRAKSPKAARIFG